MAAQTTKLHGRSVVAWIGAEMEFALSQAVASGDAFEHRPSECGHCVQNFLADLDSRAEADERDPAESISVFRAGGARPPTAEMTEFIEENRGPYGVESICSVLPIAPSTFYEHQIRWRNPDRLPTRAKRDAAFP